ncbi:MAG: hypothetical protein LH616_01275 [Ilumatobacteraceae bacterium]|nr:hypothetical protein [Ilumatobacteraceae bacterium]
MIIAVGSWRGVGATTTALLTATCLAAADESGAWLVEADPAGGVLAGRMEVPAHCLVGLERVAFPTERITVTESVASTAHVIGNLHIVLCPADPFRAFACHQPRMPWAPALRSLPGSVVIDVGTVRAGSPVWPVLAQADVVLIVSSPEASSAVAAAEWVQAAGRVSPADPGLLDAPARIVFVDSPVGLSFSRATLQADLGTQCAAWLPWEPSTVDLVHRGAAASDRRLRRSVLMGAVNQMALELTASEAMAS